MDEEQQQYRAQIIEADQKSLDAFDKSLLTLSGGALALSIAFYKDIVGPGNAQHAQLLMSSWYLWIISISLTLVSFYCSHRALRYTLEQIDSGTLDGRRPGGMWTGLTNWLTVGSGVAFLVGLVQIVRFASKTLGE